MKIQVLLLAFSLIFIGSCSSNQKSKSKLLEKPLTKIKLTKSQSKRLLKARAQVNLVLAEIAKKYNREHLLKLIDILNQNSDGGSNDDNGPTRFCPIELEKVEEWQVQCGDLIAATPSNQGGCYKTCARYVTTIMGGENCTAVVSQSSSTVCEPCPCTDFYDDFL